MHRLQTSQDAAKHQPPIAYRLCCPDWPDQNQEPAFSPHASSCAVARACCNDDDEYMGTVKCPNPACSGHHCLVIGVAQLLAPWAHFFAIHKLWSVMPRPWLIFGKLRDAGQPVVQKHVALRETDFTVARDCLAPAWFCFMLYWRVLRTKFCCFCCFGGMRAQNRYFSKEV